jgi:hypothetical protein
MDITTLAAWGEFLGGIAVVVSLGYLAVQIRTNTKTVRASNYRDVLGGMSGFNTLIVDPETAALYVRGTDDFVGLSVEDQVRFQGLMSSVINALNQTFVLHQRNLLEDVMMENAKNAVAEVFGNPGMRQWWEACEHWWPPDFREFVRETTGQ